MQVRIAILGLFLAGALAGCGEEAHVIGTIDVSEVGGWSPSPSFRLIVGPEGDSQVYAVDVAGLDGHYTGTVRPNRLASFRSFVAGIDFGAYEFPTNYQTEVGSVQTTIEIDGVAETDLFFEDDSFPLEIGELRDLALGVVVATVWTPIEGG
ncbi:MAG TPA: hypothetical protein PK668_22975 [Myxococcota bacterium]|nr:hypothetical protein [Myxococcota bacterium]HRY95559.1 hypothetical protein [Myxococcota bacterium]